MKLVKLTLIFALFCLYHVSIFAQTQPNLDNGFKPYGTYAGSDIDSINLSNGNLIVHVPMPFTFPQRGGKLSPKMVVRMSSKAWAVGTFLGPNGSFTNYWNLGFGLAAHIAQIGTGVGLDSTLDLSLHRYYEIESGPTSGYFVGGYYITTWDGGTHQLHSPTNGPVDPLGVPMSFDAIDQSGYHVDLSTPDSGTGVPTSGAIIDREGNRYQIASWATSCSKPTTSGFFTASNPGDRSVDPFGPNLNEEIEGLEDFYFGESRARFASEVDTPPPTLSTVGGTSFTTCTQAAIISTVTDANGNVIYSSFSTTPGDTMGRQPDVLGNVTATTDFSGCVTTNPNSPVNSATIYSYQGKGSVTNQVKLCMANYPIQTNFGISGIVEEQNAPTPVRSGTVQSLIVTVVLSDPTVGPNFTGSRWTFNYDSYINLTDIGLPTGGSIHYDWGQAAMPHCGSLTPVSRVVVRRTTNDNRGNISQTNYSWGTPSGGVMSNTVSDPLSNDTVHVFTSLDGAGGCLFYETSTKSYQGSQGSGSLLKQVDTTYQTPVHFSDAIGANGGFGNVLPTIIKTTIKQNGQTKISQVTRAYDQGAGNTRPSFGDVVSEQVTDWGNSTLGPVLRQTENAYQWQQIDGSGNQSYLLANLLDLPARSVIKDAGGCMVAESTYGYDEFSLAPSGMGPAQHLNAAPNSVRGNQTSVNRWLYPLTSGNCIQAPALTAPVSVPTPAITSQTKWFDSGVIAQAIDPLGHTTTFSTDPSYLGTYVTQTCSPTTSGITHCVSGTFDFNTGLIASFTNENATSPATGTTPGDSAHTSFYSYDNMFRLTSAQVPPDPNNGGLNNTNNFNFSSPSVFPITAQRVKSVTGPPSDSTTSFFDGLGRPYKTQHVVPGNLATVDTTYDIAGNTASVSNPYFSTSDPTYGITSSSFDAFGRPTQVIKQDHSISNVSYNVAVSSPGTCNDSTDEAGKQRRTCTDALGRLIEVDEPGGSSPGVQATASILVSGAFNSTWVSPSPLHLAATGTAMASLTMTNGSSHTFYFDTNQHLCHLSWLTGWANEDLTEETEAVQPLTGSSLSAVVLANVVHVFYQGVNLHIYDMQWNGAWLNLDMTVITGASSAMSGTQMATVLTGSPNSPMMFYEGTNQHLYCIYWVSTANAWQNADLHVLSGATTLIEPNGGISAAMFGTSGRIFTFFIGTNHHIITINWSGTSWVTGDNTIASGGALAVTGSKLTTAATGNTVDLMCFYEGASQHIYGIYYNGSAAAWQALDFTSFSGATNVTATLTALTNNFAGPNVFYFGSNQHLDDISWNGSAWINSDLTSLSGTTAIPAAGGSLASHGTAAGNPYHIFFAGTDQHIYHTYYSTPSWFNQDLFGLATNNVVDSGTVSLSIPNGSSPFIATVCYGISSNPFCSGKPVNATPSDIANALAVILNGTGSPVTAVVTGATLNLTWRAAGEVPVAVASLTSISDNSSLFPSGSFTSAEASFSNGLAVGSQILTSPQVTQYQYDALGNLLRIDQKGSAPSDSTQWRTRTFTYDSLSRLLTATNPESGTISYLYDADGELLQKTSPAPNQTGTSMQTVSFCYDELHRFKSKGYGAQSCPLSSPVVSYTYDAGANAKGKLVSLTDQAGTAAYTYDVLGRLATEARTLTGASNAAISKTLSYEYNLDGSLKTLHYPSGAAVSYTPDSAGRVLSAIDNGNGINYATSASYGADNSLTGFISGYSGTFLGITNAFTYNRRLQPLTMSATSPSQTVYSVGYDFHVGNGAAGNDNGNVWGITNYKDTSRSQTFTYDSLNRLTSAQNAGTDCTAPPTVNFKARYWGNSYGYDAWGNLLQKSITKCGAEHLIATSDAYNRIHASGTDYQYDAAGNMTYDATTNLSYTFDQENRITGAGGYGYIYDGDGNRVEKVTPPTNFTGGTLYWYMTPGVVAESDLAGNTTSEYVFFNGERVARRDGLNGAGGVFYYFSDHLKTASVVTDSAGVIKADSDYYPWGGELQFTNNDSNHYKFTGKERDTETGLDYFGARYYSNWLGRWVSADWSPKPIPVPYAKPIDPQTLNLYSYVRGLPTTTVDSDGHCPDGDCWQITTKSPEEIHHIAEVTKKPVLIATGVAVASPLIVMALPEEGIGATGAYLLARFAPLMAGAGAALAKARDMALEAVEDLQSLKLSSSPVTTSRINGAINALKDHASDMDLKGVVREASGALQGQHYEEVGTVVKSLTNLRNSLQGALNNPELPDATRVSYTQTIQTLNNFVQKAQPLIDEARTTQQKP